MKLKQYMQYVDYLIQHKIGVYKAGRKLGVSRFQLLVHDMSKFSTTEVFPYAKYFYGARGSDWYNEKMKNDFKLAWLNHIHKNKHHWNHWIYNSDSDGIQVFRMPEKYIREMVADWMGVSYAKGEPMSNAVAWYEKNKDALILHETTRRRVEALLETGNPFPNMSVQPYPQKREPGS